MKKVFAVTAAGIALTGAMGLASLPVLAQNVESGPPDFQPGMIGGFGRQQSLEAKAEIFGMTAEELGNALETKTMSQIALENGMDEDTFRAKMEEFAKSRWEARGLSEGEIAERMAAREARHAAYAEDHEFGSGEGNHQGGFGWRH